MLATAAAGWLLFRDNTNTAAAALIDFGGAADTAIERFRELNRQQQAGEILRLQKEIDANYRTITDSMTEMVAAATNFATVAQASDFIKETERLDAAFKTGKISADDFASGLDAAWKAMIDGSPAAAAVAKSLTEETAAAATAGREVDRKRAILEAFTGSSVNAKSATDALSGHSTSWGIRRVRQASASHRPCSRCLASLRALAKARVRWRSWMLPTGSRRPRPAASTSPSVTTRR
ncbi:hypothetical protein B0X78_02970 [bacterium AM6]|nr:hypothetical protein B0X78_02970 [bacterium AM6]